MLALDYALTDIGRISAAGRSEDYALGLHAAGQAIFALYDRFAEALEQHESVDAVDPSAADPGTPSTRD